MILWRFSPQDGGALLAVIDEATDHIVSLWDWQKTRRITESKVSLFLAIGHLECQSNLSQEIK